MAAKDVTIGDVYNVGGTGEVTIKQLAEQVIKITGSKSPITYTPYTDAYPAGFEEIQRRIPDISKIEPIEFEHFCIQIQGERPGK